MNVRAIKSKGFAAFNHYLDRERLYLATLVALMAIGFFFFLNLSGAYLDLSQQAILGWSLVLFLIVANRRALFERAPWRFVFIITATFISLRYWYWRTFDTLIYTGPLDAICMMLLYLAEGYILSVHFIGVFVTIWPLDRKSVAMPDDLALYPTVDVLIPTYSEPIDIVRVTATAAVQIDYPVEKLNVYILDDGGTMGKRLADDTSDEAWERHYQLKRLARKIDAHYITRDENIKAKAGNINNALKYIKGDIMLILDCDHVPARDILTRTVGSFLKDEKLALIQTPHFFINPDPVEKNLATFNEAPSENEMFYCAIHPGFDLWNSSYFCGSAALLRRKYLMEVGGISVQTITEDAETSIALHNKGYNSIYIKRPMVCGLSPETFDDFIIQRSRWAQGMVQIFMMRNPLKASGLSFAQRLCYFNACLFWFFGFSRVVFYLAPAAFLLMGLKVYHASVLQVLAFAIPHIVTSVVLTDYLYGKHRWPFFSELYESVISIFMIHPLVSVMLNPTKPTFKVTPKGKSQEHTFLSPFAMPFYILFLIVLFSIPMAGYKWFYSPLFRDVIFITFFWSCFNVTLALASLGAFWERRQVRGYHRAWAEQDVRVFFPRMKESVNGIIRDVSLTGVGIEITTPFPIKSEEEVTLYATDSFGEEFDFRARILRKISAGGMEMEGCRFVLNDDDFPRLVRFVYGDSKRWADLWEKKSVHGNPFRILFHTFRMAFKGGKQSILALNQTLFMLIKRYALFVYRGVRRLVSGDKATGKDGLQAV